MSIDQVDRTVVTQETTPEGSQETVRTNSRSVSGGGPPAAERTRRIIVLVFGLVQILIGARFILLLLDAREANGLVSGILNLSQLFVARSRILRTDSLNSAGSILDITAVVAIVSWTVLERSSSGASGSFAASPPEAARRPSGRLRVDETPVGPGAIAVGVRWGGTEATARPAIVNRGSSRSMPPLRPSGRPGTGRRGHHLWRGIRCGHARDPEAVDPVQADLPGHRLGCPAQSGVAAAFVTWTILQRSTTGVETTLFSVEEPVDGEEVTALANSGNLALLVGNKAGTYVMRYLHAREVLAEGTFTLVK
jgi:hypothetical protein